MVPGVDSAFDMPTLAQAQAFRAAGGRVWGGYLATIQEPGAFNLAMPWPRQAFQNVQQAGLRAIGYCSGLDDPSAIRAMAASWGVLATLDCEEGIRPDGPWVPGWLAASGAGLYGLMPVHHNPAPFRIVAEYPGFDPVATWPGPPPPEPHGWQWQGTHTEPVTGLQVDSLWLEDWFLGITGGTGMAAAPRPDGSAVDYFVVRNDRTVDHYVWTFANGMGAPENLAGGVLPFTISAFWLGNTLVVFGQAPQGTFWANIFNNGWSGWTPQGISGALPAAGPPGPPGPPGPATFIRHTHQATTDGGTPA